MSEESASPQSLIRKNQPGTAGETYLGKLCERSFLSLWSWPGLFRDQGKRGSGDGKEVCDLLVVFEKTILIFSDKQCRFPDSGNLRLDWSRWFKRAVQGAAEQAWGAERWIKEFPNRLYLDRRCTNPFPFPVQNPSELDFFRIVVAHDVSPRCKRELGGSGSLMFQSDLKGMSAHTEPFRIGDLDPQRGFVHVLDDTSLGVVMSNRDTITDFVDYLRKKELFVRGESKVFAAGEEELLACFLRIGDNYGRHHFPSSSKAPVIAFCEGLWSQFERSASRKAQIEADAVSYLWDGIIERSSGHALAGTQYYVPQGGLGGSEQIVRIMALEPRHKRRYLSEALAEVLSLPLNGRRRIRVVEPQNSEGPHYVFLTLPLPFGARAPDSDYRSERMSLLKAACIVTRSKFSDAKTVIGIATEPGLLNSDRSEDLCFLDGTRWSIEAENEAQRLQRDLHLLDRMDTSEPRLLREQPITTSPRLAGRYRNHPCPCGSGRKYKRCCGSPNQ